MFRRVLFLAMVAAVAILIGCSQSVVQAPDGRGGGTETIGVTGKSVDTTGAPLAGVLVKMRRADYLDTQSTTLAKAAVFLANVQSDTAGTFVIANVDTGIYKLELLSGTLGAAVACTVSSAGQAIDLDRLVLRRTATVRGVIPRNSQFDSTRMQAFIYGFDRSAAADMNGAFEFANLPAGSYTIKFVSRGSAYGSYDTAGVIALPGEAHNLGPVSFPEKMLPIDPSDSVAVTTILDSNGLAFFDVHRVAGVDPITRRVTYLNLSRLGIHRIDAAIGRLTALVRINVEADSLSALPAEIGMCANLEYLNVSDNQLAALPAEIVSCRSLGSLLATGNQIASLPDSLGLLQKLQYLFLDDNKLVVIPASLVEWHPDFLMVSFDQNTLCALNSDQSAWLDRYANDKAWRITQICN